MDPSTLESEASGGLHGDSAAASAPQLPQAEAGLSGEAAGAPLAAVEQAAAGPGASSDGAHVGASSVPVDAVAAASAGAPPSGAGSADATHVNRDAGRGVATEPFVGAEAAQALSPGEAGAVAAGLSDIAADAPFPGSPIGQSVPPTEPGPAADLSLRPEASPAQSQGTGDGGGGDPPALLSPDDEFPGEVEMPLVDHLEELRRRVLRSLLAVVVAAAGCLVFVRPLVKQLEAPAQGIRFLQLAPGEFLFVSLKVAGYAGLTLAIPWILFEVLAFVLPGLTRRERRLVAPTVAGSTVLFAAGLAFAWWALVPAALRFLVSYGADVVEPIWSIERYLDFVLLLMVATALAFQLPVLQLLLGALGLVDARRMLGAWRWVVLVSALAGAVLTPSTDPVTMLLLSGAITALYLIGVGLVAVVSRPKQRFGQA